VGKVDGQLKLVMQRYRTAWKNVVRTLSHRDFETHVASIVHIGRRHIHMFVKLNKYLGYMLAGVK
jgi:hypothetical protein